MRQGAVRILGSQLRRAREALELSTEEAASLLGVAPDILVRWERDEEQPPIESLWIIGERYSRPTEYFLKPVPAPPALVYFRRDRREDLREFPLETRQAVARFEELCRYEAELESLTGRTVDIKLRRHDIDDPESLSERVRNDLSLGLGPITDIRHATERSGIRVFSIVIPDASLAGLSWWHRDYGPCVLVNAQDLPGRRNFTVAHELGHLVRKDDKGSLCDLDETVPEERAANRFGGALLIPAWDLAGYLEVRPLPALPSWAELRRVAERYHVTAEALGIRAEELDLVPRGTMDRLQAMRPEAFRPRRGRLPAWRRRLGERYTSAAFRAYEEGRISLGRLARYLGEDIRTVSAAVERRDFPTRWA